MSVASFTKLLSALKTNAAFKCLRESSSIPCQVNTDLSSLAHGVQESLSCSSSQFSIASPGIHALAAQTSLCHSPQHGRQWTLHRHQVRRTRGLESSKGEGWQGQRKPEAKQLLHTRDNERGEREEAQQVQRAKETLGKNWCSYIRISSFTDFEALEIFGSTPGKETVPQLPAVTSNLPTESALKDARDWELALQAQPFKAIGISRGTNAPHPIELKTLRSYLILLKNLPPPCTTQQPKLLSTLGD